MDRDQACGSGARGDFDDRHRLGIGTPAADAAVHVQPSQSAPATAKGPRRVHADVGGDLLLDAH
jgi:hypothetical protein